MKPRLIGVAAVAALVALLSLVIYLQPIGRQIGPVSIKTIDGKTVELFRKGPEQVTLVSFWASTCQPCIKEMPDLIRLYRNYSQEKFTLIGISMPYDPPNLTLAAVKHFNIPWPVALDIKGEWVKTFGDINATPTTLLLDPSGRIRWEASGPIDFKQLRQKLSKLLAELT